MPGAPTFLPTKSLASLIVHAVAGEGGDQAVGDGVHRRGAVDGDEIQAAVDGLQEHRRRRAADLDRIGDDRRRDVGVDADQRHVDVEAVLGEDALVARHHRRSAVGRRSAGDMHLDAVRRGAARGAKSQRRAEKSRSQPMGGGLARRAPLGVAKAELRRHASFLPAVERVAASLLIIDKK